MLFAARRFKAGYIRHFGRFGRQIMTRGAGDGRSIFVFGVAGVQEIVITGRCPLVVREDQRFAGGGVAILAAPELLARLMDVA